VVLNGILFWLNAQLVSNGLNSLVLGSTHEHIAQLACAL
jgi:hypothetical protein